MKHRKVSGDIDNQNTPLWWDAAGWLAALAAFAVALLLSYREIHYNIPHDLRSPNILLVNALLATVFAFGFAAHGGALTRWADAHLCLRFGLWAAAVFRLVPPIINEEVLYFKNYISFDAPYVVLGACVHGGLAMLFTYPYAIRALDPKSHQLLVDDKSLWEMCGSVILVFFIVASLVRLLLR